MKIKSKLFTKLAALMLSVLMIASVPITHPVEADAASKRTAIGLAEFGLKAYRDGWQYNYGSYGQLNSKGQRITDCSGLIYAYLCWNDSKNGPVANYSWPRGSTQQYKYCSKVGTGSIPRTHGLLLFHWTGGTNTEHVGIYVGGDKSVDCSDYNVDMRYMTASTYKKWTAWGKLKNVEYPTDGWYKFDGKPFFYVDGQYVVNKTLTIDGTNYTFDKNGNPSPKPSGYSTGSGTVGDGESMKTTDGVNVRTSASLDANVIRAVPQGTKVTVLNKDNDEWYKVKLSDGTVGYIFSQYLSGDGQPNKSEGGENVNLTGQTTTGLNLRSEANTNSSVKQVLPKGTSLVITKKLSGWYKVKLGNGTTGYVSADYVKVSDSSSGSEDKVSISAQTTALVNVRKTASMSGAILDTVATGTKVTITDRSNSSWYKVKLSDGTVGYIYSSYLKEVSSDSSSSDSSSGSFKAKTTAAVNLRKKASTSSAIIKTVAKGTTVTVTKKYNSKWYKVKLSDGKTGYMSSQYVKKSTSSDSSDSSSGSTSGSKTATTTAGVNLRSDKNMGASVICVVSSGTKVTVTDSSSKEWLGVKLDNGTKGYISAQYLTLSLSGKTTTAVNLRSAANTSSSVKKIVDEGTTVTIVTMTNSDWFKVKVGSTTGYMASAYIDY